MMRRRLAPGFAFCALALVAFATAAPGATAPAPAPAFQVPQPIVRTLANGLQVAVFRRPGLPIVQVQLLIPAGVTDEPESQSGVANAAAQLIRQGTTSRTSDAFADDLARLGGTISSTASRDYSTVSGQFLAADFEAGLELVADAVIHPIFPPEAVEQFQNVTANAIAQVHQNAGVVADEQIWALTWAGRPYARPQIGTFESIGRLTRDAIVAFHRDYYRPAHAVLVIAGDVDPERAFSAATDGFGTWAGTPRASTAGRAELPKLSGVRIGLVDRPGVTQTEVRIGLLAPPRAAPDFNATQIANYLLGGGGFSSRLTQSVRVSDGLSYDARSVYSALQDGGLITVSAFTRSDSVAILVNRVREELRRFATEPPSEPQVEAARSYFRKVYPLQFETLSSLVGQWLGPSFYGLPGDELTRYPERISSVTAADVAAAGRTWFDADHLVIVAVGPASELRPLLAPLGAIEMLTPEGSLANAPKPPEVRGPTPESTKRGHDVVSQALAAHGGLERLRRVKDSVVDGDLRIGDAATRVSGTVEQVRKDPYRMIFLTRFPSFTSQQVLRDNRAWERIASGDSVFVTESDSLNMLGLRAGFTSDIVHLMLSAADPAAVVYWVGHEFVDGEDADVVAVESPGLEPRRFSFDAAHHRLVAMEQSRDASGRYIQRRVYKDYRPVSGLQWPFYEGRSINGRPATSLQLRAVAINTGVSDTRFVRPEAHAPSTHR